MTAPVEVVEHAWIPLADGTRLAARFWLPSDAYEHPVPAILEYLPYRLSDGTATYDHAQMTYFAVVRIASQKNWSWKTLR